MWICFFLCINLILKSFHKREKTYPGVIRIFRQKLVKYLTSTAGISEKIYFHLKWIQKISNF